MQARWHAPLRALGSGSGWQGRDREQLLGEPQSQGLLSVVPGPPFVVGTPPSLCPLDSPFLRDTLGDFGELHDLLVPDEGRVNSEPHTTRPCHSGARTAPGTYLGEFRSASSGAALGLWIPSRRDLRCCSCKARRRGMAAAAADAPGPPRPPKTHLLGLQEIGVPQLADDHLTLLNRGVLTQVGGQAHQGGCPHHLLALVLAACH